METIAEAGHQLTDEDRRKSAEIRKNAAAEKRKLIRSVFEQNPDALIDAALNAVRVMSPDGKAIGSHEAVLIREDVRRVKGLPPLPKKPVGWHKRPKSAGSDTPAATGRAAPWPDLPPDIVAAAKDLQAKLEASTEIGSFLLAFSGGIVKIRWAPFLSL